MTLALLAAASAATLSVGGAGPYTSLASAVAASRDGDTIEVAPGVWTEAVDPAGRDLTLRSTGGASVTFLAPPAGEHALSVTRGETVHLEGFTLTPSGARAIVVTDSVFSGVDLLVEDAGAVGLRGGGLAADGATVTLVSVSFSGGAATWGGQLHATDGAVVSGTDLVFSGGAATYGGALHVEGGAEVTLAGVLATGATSARDGGFAYVDGGALALSDLALDAPFATGGDGGGFYVTGHGALTLADAEIAGAAADVGGAVAASDGAVLLLEDVAITDATALAGGALELDGAVGGFTRLSVSDATADEGGAARVHGGADVTCEGCAFSACLATGDGGALLLGTGSSWDDVDGAWQDAEAGGSGGAVAIEGTATARFDGSVFEANRANADGGALSHGGTGALALTTVSFLRNAAAVGDGGAVRSTAPLTIEGGAFDGNVATLGGGGAVAAAGTLAVEGARFVGNVADDDGGAVLASGSALSLREATFFRNEAGREGGAVCADAVSTITLARGYLHGNAAESGGAVRLRAPTTSAALTNLRVTDNVAVDGGGLHVDGAVQVSVTNCTFAGNDAADRGGHVYAAAPVRLVNDLFTQALDGGGVWGATDAGSDRYYTLVWADAGGGWAGGFSDPTGTSGNLSVDPRLSAYTADGDETDDDLSLALSSPAIDAGSHAIFDVDGTRSDIGAFGGPDADVLDGDGDGWFDNVDCDDDDPDVYPGGPEVAYDAIDQDCSGADLDDVDGDGFGLVSGGDCDDADAAVFPGAPDTWYDGVDSDCGGGSDFDRDGDRHDAIIGGGDDCDDDDPLVYGTRPEAWYDGVDQDCDGRSDYDRDRDGHDALAYGGDDCDDLSAARFPGNTELPYDTVDQDCSGADLVDVDGDGWVGAAAGGADCNDGNPAAYPGAFEDPADGLDTDCDGYSEWDRDGDGYENALGAGDDCDDADPAVHPGALEVWYDGRDDDCDGRDDDQDADGWPVATDCDDTDPAVNPDAIERENGRDDDCDGWAETSDRDGDGLTDLEEAALGTDPADPDTDDDTLGDGQEVADRDADGLLDALDPDDDGDGVPTRTELTTDLDGDGAPDTDVDGDGTPNAHDLDSDADGFPDRDEGLADADRDGLPDYLDHQGPFTGGGCGGAGWAGLLAGLPFLGFGRRNGRGPPGGGGTVASHATGGRAAPEASASAASVATASASEEKRNRRGAEYAEGDAEGCKERGGWESSSLSSPSSPPSSPCLPLRLPLAPSAPLRFSSGSLSSCLPLPPSVPSVPPPCSLWFSSRFFSSSSPPCLPLRLAPSAPLRFSSGSLSSCPPLPPSVPSVPPPCSLWFSSRFFSSSSPPCLPLRLPLAPSAPLRFSSRLFSACLLATLASAPAHALDAHGFHLGAATGDPACFTRLGCASVRAAGEWDAGVVFDYAEDPLAEVLPEGRAPVLDALATATVAGAWSFGGLQVDLAAPVHLFGVDPSGGFTALGDVRAGAQVPLRRDRGGWPALAARAAVWAPTGAEAHHVGSAGPRAMVAAAAGKELGRFGVTALAGVMAGFPAETRNLREGLGPVAGVGVAYRVTDALSTALELSTASDLGQLPVEATLSARARLPRGAWLAAGGAAGLGAGVGASRWRAFLGIGWSRVAPPPPPPPPVVDPNADRDGDGFVDALDKCPDNAETVDGFEDDDGCPELDGDGDGVPFEKDACPREPIRPEQDPRWSDGCPKIAEFAGDHIVITETIFFKEGRAELLPSSERVLDAVRAVMAVHPEIAYFLVEGHTNTTGSDAYNLRLSDARAFTVMRWLVESGVSHDRLLSKGFGEARPLLPGDTEEALAVNRRVEFRVVRVEDVPADARRIELPPEVSPSE